MISSKFTTTEQALNFVRHEGVVLVSAKGPASRLTEAIVGERIKGSWWAHKQSHRIFAILQAVTESDQVLVCRLIDGKVTLVHRRLWPSLVRIARRLTPEQLAQVQEQHTSSGRHETREIPFPDWVPADVANEARTTTEKEALAAFSEWLTLSSI